MLGKQHDTRALVLDPIRTCKNKESKDVYYLCARTHLAKSDTSTGLRKVDPHDGNNFRSHYDFYKPDGRRKKSYGASEEHRG